MSETITSSLQELRVVSGPTRRVLVGYEPSKRGQAALRHAIELARAAGSRLTVTTVVPHARVNGCARCRQSAVLWNQEMREVAAEEMAGAAELVGDRQNVEYVAGYGEPLLAMTEAAQQCAADVIVLPEQPTGLGRLFSPRIAEKLSGRGQWEVVVAPAAPDAKRTTSRGYQARRR